MGLSDSCSKSGEPGLVHPTAEVAEVRGERPVFIVLCAPLRPPRLDYLY